MNELITSTERMTSLDIAELTGKEHKNILQSIRSMESAWEKVNGLKFQLVDYIDSKGEKRPCYSLTKTECIYIATKFNDEARAKLILRWEQLEKKNASQMLVLPQNYKEALLALAAKEEEKEQLELENKIQAQKIAEDAPKVEACNKFLDADGSISITQLGKLLKQEGVVETERIGNLLKEMNVLRKDMSTNTPRAEYLDCFRQTQTQPDMYNKTHTHWKLNNNGFYKIGNMIRAYMKKGIQMLNFKS